MKLTKNPNTNRMILSDALQTIEVQGKSNVFGGGKISSPGGTTYFNPQGWWFARVIGDINCTSASTTSEALDSTDTIGNCCTTSATTTGYTLVKVYPAGCGTWAEGDEREEGLGFELNNNFVPNGAVVQCYPGFADEWLFAYGGTGTSSAFSFDWKCVAIPQSFDCEVDQHGNYTGNTEIVYQWFALPDVDIDCNNLSSQSMPTTSDTSSGSGGDVFDEIGGQGETDYGAMGGTAGTFAIYNIISEG